MPAEPSGWGTHQWFELLAWPRPLDPDQALAVLRTWATDPRSPQLVLEATASSSGVRYLVAVHSASSTWLKATLQANFPGLILIPYERPLPRASAVRSLRASTRHRPLKTADLTSSARALLIALTHVRGQESATLQLVLGPRRIPLAVATGTTSSATASIWDVALYGNGPRLDSEKRVALRDKVGDHGFACLIRLSVTAEGQRVPNLIAALYAAVRTNESAGLQLRLRRESPVRFARALGPRLLWPLRLNCQEVLALTGWPIGDDDLPGQPAAHPRILPPSPGTAGAGRSFATSSLPGKEQPIGIAAREALQHVWFVGPTGSGKSNALGRLIESDIRDGRAVVVIEPKGDLVADALSHVPEERHGDVVVLDPTDTAIVGLNPLAHAEGRAELVADRLLSIFRQLYGEAIGPRSSDILYAGLLTLANQPKASLVALPLLLTNDRYRRSVTAGLHDPFTLGPFWAQFNGWSDGERASAIAPVMNKLRPLLRPAVRSVLGQTAPRFNLRDVMRERKILLVPLRRGLIGPEAASLIGSLVLAELWQVAQERSAISQQRRHPVMVYVDEIQDYLHLGTDLGEALAQARGYGVGFHLAHQFTAQLPSDMRAAVAANARSRVGFQLAHADAVELAKGHPELSADDFIALGQYEIYASLFAAGRVQPYASGRTLPPTAPISDPQRLRLLSRQRYGQTPHEIEADFAALLTPTTDLGATGRRRRQA